MFDCKEKVLEEARELADRLNELNKYMSEDEFPKLSRVEKDLLYEQSRGMSVYLQILGKRLENFGIEFSHKKGEKIK